MFAIIIHEKYRPTASETDISLTDRHIFANLNIKTTQQDVMEFSPFIGRKFVLKPISVWLCFSKTTKVEFLILRAAWAQPRGMRASFHSMECVKLWGKGGFWCVCVCVHMCVCVCVCVFILDQTNVLLLQRVYDEDVTQEPAPAEEKPPEKTVSSALLFSELWSLLLLAV